MEMNSGDIDKAIEVLGVDDGRAQELVERTQAGDSEAFADIYRLYFDRVYSYMRLMLKDRDQADDATQTVFANALEALPRYEPRSPFAAWLMTIVRNVALDQLRANGREQPTESEEIDRLREAEAQHTEGDLDDSLDWIADPDLLFLLQRLPQPQRQVLFLRYLIDLPGVEVARVLHRSHTDVRTLQHRALRFLEERLTALGKAPERRAPERPDGREAMRAPVRFAPVLRARRWSLM